MGDKTIIRWTDASWNPSTGCSYVSEGCAHCYAREIAWKMKFKYKNKKYDKGFKFTIHPEALEMPLHWKQPKMIFVDSMSDLFNEKMTDDFLVKCFAVMKKADWHTYQILTKRPALMLEFTKKHPEIFKKGTDHIWLGVSVELEKYNFRMDLLKQTPVKIKFISAEPLLGSLGSNLQEYFKGIDWVIVGGESGQNFRTMDVNWARDIRDQLLKMGDKYPNRPAFFFKQSSGIRTEMGLELDGKKWEEYPE